MQDVGRLFSVIGGLHVCERIQDSVFPIRDNDLSIIRILGGGFTQIFLEFSPRNLGKMNPF